MFVGGVIVLFAFAEWITFPYPDISPFRLLGVWSAGFLAPFTSMILWLKVVIIATPGVLLFSAGKALINKNKVD